jgi:hypothetical protein
LPVSAFALLFGIKTLSGSIIGGIAETQDMLDFCGHHNITPDVEVISIQQVNEPHFSEGEEIEIAGERFLHRLAVSIEQQPNAVVLCVDEKTGIQALDRTQPMLPLRATKPRSWTNENVRHGTRTLLASLDIGTGRVIAHVQKQPYGIH